MYFILYNGIYDEIKLSLGNTYRVFKQAPESVQSNCCVFTCSVFDEIDNNLHYKSGVYRLVYFLDIFTQDIGGKTRDEHLQDILAKLDTFFTSKNFGISVNQLPNIDTGVLRTRITMKATYDRASDRVIKYV